MIAIQEYHFNIYFETRPAGCQSSWSAQRNAFCDSTPHRFRCAWALGRGQGFSAFREAALQRRTAHTYKQGYTNKRVLRTSRSFRAQSFPSQNALSGAGRSGDALRADLVALLTPIAPRHPDKGRARAGAREEVRVLHAA